MPQLPGDLNFWDYVILAPVIVGLMGAWMLTAIVVCFERSRS
jgi:hypothetical protein